MVRKRKKKILYIFELDFKFFGIVEEMTENIRELFKYFPNAG